VATSTDLRAAIEEVQLAIPGEEARSFDIENYDQQAALDRLAKQLGAMPWWVISTLVHSVIFLLCTLLVVGTKTGGEQYVPIIVDPPRQPPPVITTEPRPRGPEDSDFEIDSDVMVERPVPVKDLFSAEEVPQLSDDVEGDARRGDPNKLADIPTGGFGKIGSMGLSGGGLAGAYSYSSRNERGRARATGSFGGSKITESAVNAALAWLARHQEEDGHWAAAKWEATYRQHRVDVSMTSFALLAFLGAGHSPHFGQYRDNARRAQNWLIGQQKKGSFGRCMYTQGIATLVLAESCGMIPPGRKDPRLRRAAQDAVDVVVRAQGPYEAWNYGAKKKAGRNDTSVTGWNLMALKSARMSGLRVDNIAFQGCMRWLDRATDRKTGRCAYAGTSARVRRGRGSHAMCAAALLMRQFMGMNRTAPVLVAAADNLIKHPPRWEKGQEGKVNLYYWYYGTLGMFQQGGRYWPVWNRAMKKALCENQRTGRLKDGSKDDVDGSWDPVGTGGIPRGGRVFSTALGALCLEVYYRYLPMQGR